MTADAYREAIADLGKTVIDLNTKFVELLKYVEAPSWITAAQIEEKYHLTKAQVRYKASQGLIESEKMGTVTLYKESDVIKFASRTRA